MELEGGRGWKRCGTKRRIWWLLGESRVTKEADKVASQREWSFAEEEGVSGELFFYRELSESFVEWEEKERFSVE